MSPTRHTELTPATRCFIVGAAGTALTGLAVQAVAIPLSDISDDRWSYPWAAGPFVAVSLLYTLMHLAVAVGLAAFGRSGVAGTSRAARSGVALAIAGTLMLAAGEIASIPVRNALVDDGSAQIVGGVYGLGVLLSAVGLLLLGKATLAASHWRDWRRYVPLAAGIWTTLLVAIPVAIPKALPGGVAIYGVFLLLMALSIHRNRTTTEGLALGHPA